MAKRNGKVDTQEARATQGTVKGSLNGSDGFKGYVNVNLTPAQKQAIKLWREDVNFDTLLDDTLRAGYRISLKWDTYSSSLMAVMTHSQQQHPNTGYVLTERASTAYAAFERVLYIHDYILDGLWEKNATRPLPDVDEDWG